MRLPLCLITARENSSEHTARPANHHSHIIYHTIPPSVCLSKDHRFPFPQCFLPSVYLCNVTTTRTIGQQTPPAFKHAAGITYVSVPDTLHDFRQYAGQCFDKRRPPLFFHLRCILDSPWCDVTALYVRVVALKLHLLTCIILVRIMHNLCIRLPVLKNVS